jgi:hypothetical protein
VHVILTVSPVRDSVSSADVWVTFVNKFKFKVSLPSEFVVNNCFLSFKSGMLASSRQVFRLGPDVCGSFPVAVGDDCPEPFAIVFVPTPISTPQLWYK